MIDKNDYAQMAGHVYNAANFKNRIEPLADKGWSVDWLPDQKSGFSAGTFVKGNDVVIAFTGTNESYLRKGKKGTDLFNKPPMTTAFRSSKHHPACHRYHVGLATLGETLCRLENLMQSSAGVP